MSSTGVKSPQTAGLGCVQRAQGVPLLGHPCFWVEVAAILYTDTETKSRILDPFWLRYGQMVDGVGRNGEN